MLSVIRQRVPFVGKGRLSLRKVEKKSRQKNVTRDKFFQLTLQLFSETSSPPVIGSGCWPSHLTNCKKVLFPAVNATAEKLFNRGFHEKTEVAKNYRTTEQAAMSAMRKTMKKKLDIFLDREKERACSVSKISSSLKIIT